MKTSNKLLLGMYILIIISTLLTYFVVLNFDTGFASNESKETLIFNMQIDSMILNLTSESKSKIEVGDSFLVKYPKTSDIKTNRKGKTLYIDVNNSVDIIIPDSIKYISVYAKSCYLSNFNQDSLSLEILNLKYCMIHDSKIKNLSLKSKASRFDLNRSFITTLNADLKDNSIIQKANNSIIKNMQGVADSTSSINVTGFKKINIESKNSF